MKEIIEILFEFLEGATFLVVLAFGVIAGCGTLLGAALRGAEEVYIAFNKYILFIWDLWIWWLCGSRGYKFKEYREEMKVERSKNGTG